MASAITINEALLGKRVLVDFEHQKMFGGVTEATVVELSPTGLNVKLKLQSRTQWFKSENLNIIEILSKEVSA